MEKIPLSDREPTEAVENVHLTRLVAGERAAIQHFRIEPGAVVPEHSTPHEQLGYVFDGVLTFVVDGEEVEVGPDDSYRLASEEPHGVENRGDVPAIGIDVVRSPGANPD